MSLAVPSQRTRNFVNLNSQKQLQSLVLLPALPQTQTVRTSSVSWASDLWTQCRHNAALPTGRNPVFGTQGEKMSSVENKDYVVMDSAFLTKGTSE